MTSQGHDGTKRVIPCTELLQRLEERLCRGWSTSEQLASTARLRVWVMPGPEIAVLVALRGDKPEARPTFIHMLRTNPDHRNAWCSRCYCIWRGRLGNTSCTCTRDLRKLVRD
jgi:hypothetical protein